MVLPPKIKVLNLPTVYAMYMETGGKNVVTATVLLPKLKVLNLPTVYAMYMEAGGKT